MYIISHEKRGTVVHNLSVEYIVWLKVQEVLEMNNVRGE